MFVKLLLYALSGIIGLFLAAKYVPGIDFHGVVKDLLLAGLCLGAVNFLIKPLIKLITLPLNIITLGLFGIVINMAMVFLVVRIIFPAKFTVEGFLPILYAVIIIWLINFLLGLKK